MPTWRASWKRRSASRRALWLTSKYAANLENYKRNTGHTHPLAAAEQDGSKQPTEVHFAEHKDK